MKLVYLPKPKLYCNLNTSDAKWHGWLQDETGTAIRRATKKQYAEAQRRRAAILTYAANPARQRFGFSI
jgi:hypothetical protein